MTAFKHAVNRNLAHHQYRYTEVLFRNMRNVIEETNGRLHVRYEPEHTIGTPHYPRCRGYLKAGFKAVNYEAVSKKRNCAREDNKNKTAISFRLCENLSARAGLGGNSVM